MQPPESTIHDRYRALHSVDARPGFRLYRGRDEQTGRAVLIAALPAEEGAARDDLELLARHIAVVRHDAMLPLTDHFAEGESYYLVCDDPGGQDLERALRARGGALPESDAITQVVRLLGSLDQLHSQRPPIYLGDPLPSDLWIDDSGLWRLAPFALARHIGQAPSPYRAPELAAPDAEPTAASDLYAMGALLYYALTGWPPPTAEQQEAGTPLVGPRSLNPALSPLAEQALLRALQIRAPNRYQVAREMRVALETVRMMGGRSLGLGPDVLGAPTTQLAGPPAPQPAAPPPSYPTAPPTTQPAAPPTYPTAPPATQPSQPYPPGIYPAPNPAAPPGYAPPPGQPYPPGIYPQQQRRGLSTGCLVAIAVVLTLLAVGVCAALFLLVPGSPLRGLLSQPSPAAPTALSAGAPTALAAPTAAATLPTSAPSALGPHALTVQNAAQITQTRDITGTGLGPVAYSPDGKTLAVGASNLIRLHNAAQLDDQHTISVPAGQISSLAWSPDGKTLAAGALDDPIVRLFDPTNGQQIRELKGHADGIRSLAFSPDGKTLASGSLDQTVRLWDPASGALRSTLKGHTNLVGGVAFSPDGATLASSSRDGSVRLWEVATGQPRSGFAFQTDIDPNTSARYWTTGLAYSPDGKTLAVGSVDGTVHLLNSATGSELRVLRGHEDLIVIRGVLFSPDGKTLATASRDGTIRLWNPETGEQTGQLGGPNKPGHRLQIIAISISPDGSRLASSSDEEGQVLIWDVAGQKVADSMRIGQGLITELRFSPDSGTLGAVGFNGGIRLHQLAQRDSIDFFGSALAVQALAFLPNGQMAVINDQNEITLFSRSQPTGQTLTGMSGKPLAIVASRNGKIIAAGDSAGAITLWDADTASPKPALHGDLSAISRMAINDDGTLIAAAGPSSDPKIEIWDAVAGKKIQTLTQAASAITDLDFQPRGEMLAAAELKGSLWLWKPRTGQLAKTLAATSDQGWFNGLAFSPDGALLATTSPNGDLQILDAASGSAAAQVNFADGAIALAFSPNGEQIAVSVRDRSVRLLGLPGS